MDTTLIKKIQAELEEKWSSKDLSGYRELLGAVMPYLRQEIPDLEDKAGFTRIEIVLGKVL